MINDHPGSANDTGARTEPHSSVLTADAASPVRVQLSRAKGWRMPPNTVKVDRSTRWGNPWKIHCHTLGPIAATWWVWGPRSDEECATEADALALSLRKFRFYAESRPDLFSALRGKNLACWCRPGEPCHADVLLELANAPETPAVTGGVGLEPTSTTDAGRAPGTNQSPIQQTEPS